MAANAFGGRIRTRLRLGSFLPQATDILPICPYPAWHLGFMCPMSGVSPVGEYTFTILTVIDSKDIRGVITDWAGVLTTPILATVQAWIQADDIDWASYRTVMRAWVYDAYRQDGSRNPIHALERGECSGAEFERMLAAELLRIDGGPVLAEGLLRRMFAASLPVPAMYDTIRALRGAGFGTALLSNSWGCDEYPRADFPALFDAVVISAEVGMRKPEEGIFRYAAGTLGLEPAECVFIDDIEANVNAATACGMTALVHTDAAATAAALQDLLGVPLTWSRPANLVP
ncbi:MAG: HAD family phosphatase [Streptosporangiaceae bacterium]